MRTESKNPYRWFFRNLQHADGGLASENKPDYSAGFFVVPGAGLDGRNRAFTRAMRSANPPEPSRELLTGRITGWTGFRQYTHPRSARA